MQSERPPNGLGRDAPAATANVLAIHLPWPQAGGRQDHESTGSVVFADFSSKSANSPDSVMGRWHV